MQAEVDKVFIHDVIYNYIAELISRTRQHPMLELGVSPRGTIALAGMIKHLPILPEEIMWYQMMWRKSFWQSAITGYF